MPRSIVLLASVVLVIAGGAAVSSPPAAAAYPPPVIEPPANWTDLIRPYFARTYHVATDGAGCGAEPGRTISAGDIFTRFEPSRAVAASNDLNQIYAWYAAAKSDIDGRWGCTVEGTSPWLSILARDVGGQLVSGQTWPTKIAVVIVGYHFPEVSFYRQGFGPLLAELDPTRVAAPALASTSIAVVPARLLDSRRGSSTIDGLHAGTGLRPGGSVTAVVVAGRGRVDKAATAVVLNVTVTDSPSDGFVTLYGCGTFPPTASNLNWTARSTVANLVVTSIGVDGKVCLYTSAATHLIVDVAAQFASSSSFVPIVPARLLESRPALSTVDGLSNAFGKLATGSVTVLQVAGRGGIPRDAASAVLNLTATEPEGDGFVTIYPCGAPRPIASALNFATGRTNATAAFAPLAADGSICVFASFSTHLVIDAIGAFLLDSLYVPLQPARLLESRAGLSTVDGRYNDLGVLAAGSTTEVMTAERAGISSTARTVALTVTATDASASGFVTVFACGDRRPTSSNLNFTANSTVSNAVVTMDGAHTNPSVAGKVCVYTSAATHLVVDVTGYFRNA